MLSRVEDYRQGLKRNVLLTHLDLIYSTGSKDDAGGPSGKKGDSNFLHYGLPFRIPRRAANRLWGTMFSSRLGALLIRGLQ